MYLYQKCIMKLSYLGIVVFCLLSLFSCNMEKEKITPEPEKALVMNNGKQLRHIVLFKFKEDASEAEIAKVEEVFANLPEKISEIKDFEWGINNSPENLNKNFTHGFLLTFDSEEGRDIYLPHPDHKAFVEIVSPILEDVFVLDYWTN